MDGTCSVYKLTVPVFTTVIISLGFIGNILSFCILNNDKSQSATIFLLSALALVDFAFLAPALVLLIIPAIAEQNNLRTTPGVAQTEKYGWAVASFLHTTTVWMTTLVTVHRYMTVCKPNHKFTKKLRDLYSTKFQLAIIIICSFCFIVPRFFESVVVNVKSGNDTFNRYVTVSSSFHKSKIYQIVYKTLLYHLMMFAVPLFTMLVSTIKLLKFLKQRHKARQSLNLKQRSEDNITCTLVVVVTVFIICQTPTPISRILFAIFGDEGRKCGHPYFYLEPISDFLVVLNSSVNCIIYIICVPKFRKDITNLCQLYDCCKRNLREEATESHSVSVLCN